MKPDQDFTPKYWVGHDRTTDDIIPSTLAKSRSITGMLMENKFGNKYWEDDDLEIIMIEVKQVEL